ncbi:MAG: ABC transporter permease subunit [Clostridia bacterium]|jgi:ABC-2 type transport system permease protein
MSWTIFKANLRNNRTIWIIMTCVFCFYVSTVVSLFDPEGAQTMEDMLDMLPDAMIGAFGLDNLGTSLLTFITGYLYGFLIFLFPMVISVTINHRLIASLVDKGSMAYLLATPNSRLKIAMTQAVFSLVTMTAFFLFITPFTIVVSEAMFPGELEVGKFILVNVYALLMYFTIGGIGFFASCIANESKTSLSIGVGLPVAFLILQMLGGIVEKLSWIGNLSLYSLYDPDKLIAGDGFAYMGMAVFVLLAAVLYGGGIYFFNRRDLHV